MGARSGGGGGMGRGAGAAVKDDMARIHINKPNTKQLVM